MRKNDELIGNVSAIGSNMEGIVRIDEFICFVPYALLGEKIKFKVLKTTKNIAFCKLIEVLTPAEERVRPLCPIFTKCGGCGLQHLRYKEQLKLKTNLVGDCLRKIAGLEVNVLPCVKSEYEYEYRNKLQLPIRCVNGENKIGFFAENSHRIVETDNCYIQQPWVKDIIKIVKDFISKTGVSCYDESSLSGLLRHVVVRSVDNALIIVVVINGKTLPNAEVLISMILKKFIKFSLYVNSNTSTSNVIMGETSTLLYGDGVYETEEFSVKYPVTPHSFIQVNSGVKHKLYQEVIKLVGANENSTVIDAYSGAGLMTAMLSKNAKRAIGIEIVKEAVEASNALAKRNGLADKITNYCAPCEEKLPEIIKDLKGGGEEVAVVLDPPRKGCDRRVLEALLDAQPDKIVYVSCSPQTLSRDLGILLNTLVYEGNELKRNLTPNGLYKITKIQPYDMFPQTKHVETIVCLTKI